MAVVLIEVPDSDESLRFCIWCRLLKPVAAFAFRSKALGTRQSHCRSCHAAYRRSHYLRNRPEYIAREVERIRRRRTENRHLLRAYLRSHPCVTCGESDIVTLQFDHRDRATKRQDVGILVIAKPWSVVCAEIEKCDVRCANCHRRRTLYSWVGTEQLARLVARSLQRRSWRPRSRQNQDFAAARAAERQDLSRTFRIVTKLADGVELAVGFACGPTPGSTTNETRQGTRPATGDVGALAADP